MRKSGLLGWFILALIGLYKKELTSRPVGLSFHGLNALGLS